jgi:hypothetical protein
VNDKVIRVWKQWKPQNALLRQCAYRNTKYSIGPYFFRFPCENCVGNSQSNCIKEQSDGTCFLHFSCIQTWIIEANASLTGARYQDQSMNTEFASNGQSNSTLPRLSILQILHGRREARELIEFSNYYLHFSAITE